MRKANDRATALNTTTLSNQTMNVLAKAGIELRDLLTIDLTIKIAGIGAKRLDEINAFVADNQSEPEIEEKRRIDTSKVEAIRDSLLNSTQAIKDIEFYTGSKGRKLDLKMNLMKSFHEGFLADDHYDVDIAKYINKMVDKELHNHIAALSYIISDYGTGCPIPAYRESAKIALAMTIMVEYTNLFPEDSRFENKARWKENGTKTFDKIWYAGSESFDSIKKNELHGLGFVPGIVLETRVKGKAGFKGKKLPSKFKKLAKNVSSMKLRLCDDIDTDELYDYMLTSKEYVSHMNGDFIDSKNLTRLVRKTMIAEKLEETQDRYKHYINILKSLYMSRDAHNIPLYLSIHFEYRGRMNYDIKNMLLNPQAKIGKFMWEAYTPRILGELDYKWLAFSAVSAVTRLNPDKAIELFEADEDKYINALLDEDDYLQLAYNKRVIKAIDAYRDGTPSRIFIFKDYTNGGAIHFASGMTRERKAMGACNLFDVDTVNDPHSLLMESFNSHLGTNASRDDIKKAVSQGITAGITAGSAISKINEFFANKESEEFHAMVMGNHKGISAIKTDYIAQPMAIREVPKPITEEAYEEIVADVYGKTGKLFQKYNAFGKSLIDSAHSVLEWRTKDGFPAMSIAYVKAQKVTEYYVTTEPRSAASLRSMSIFRNMPVFMVRQGKDYATPQLSGDFAKAKMSGFLANVTHSIDGTSNRANMAAVARVGASGIFIHDNMVSMPAVQEIILQTAKEDILDNYRDLPFRSAAVQAAQGRADFPARHFVLSQDETFNIGGNFLQA